VRFTITGRLAGLEASATWDDGELSGDPTLVSWIRLMAAHGELVSIAGVVSGPASIDDPLLARATLWCSVTAPRELSGDEPDELELEVPHGAVP
jgi:hypothetical protein